MSWSTKAQDEVATPTLARTVSNGALSTLIQRPPRRMPMLSWMCLSPVYFSIAAVVLTGGLLSAAAQSLRDANTNRLETATAARNASRQEVARRSYARLPLSFEVNQGQTDPSVHFLSHGPGYTVFLTPDEAVFVFKGFEVAKMTRAVAKGFRGGPPFRQVGKTEVMRVGLEGRNPDFQIVPLDELPGKTNYFIGNKASNWHTGVSNYRRVKYSGVYPGIDLTYYGNQGQLEFDFSVTPGADPGAIRMRFQGADRLEIGNDGTLRIKGSTSEIQLHRPSIYQRFDSKNQTVDGGYVLRGNNEVGFRVGQYDRQKSLIIDPVLSYSTYLGGNLADYPVGIAVDSEGNMYVAGTTTSTNFPTANGYPSSINSNDVAFVSKLDSTGTVLTYSTYLGGSNWQYGAGVALDRGANVYLAGTTLSADFPIVNGFQTSLASPNGNAFIARIDTSQSGVSSLVYSTYLGGGGNTANQSGDGGGGIAVDQSGNAYVTGRTTSDATVTPFPTTPSAYQANLASLSGNAFLTVANTNVAGAASLVYSTYLGGGGTYGDYGAGVTVDDAGDAYLTGYTTSGAPAPFPTTSNGFQTSMNSPYSNCFVTEIATTKSGAQSLVYSTLLGGSTNWDGATAIAIDSSGKIYITGYASSTDFPVTASAYQNTNSASGKSFVAKFDMTQNSQQSLVFSTYLGGSNWEQGNGIAVDASGDVVTVGVTGSSDFPTTSNALQASSQSQSSTGYISELNPTATGLLYSTYFGGSCGGDQVIGVSLDSVGNLYATGATCSTDFPTTPNAYQSSLPGSYNGFIAKFTMSTPTISNISPASGPIGTSVTIAGTGFGSNQGTSTVTFNGTAATPTNWSMTAIVAPVPLGATTGEVVVTVSGAASNGSSFTVVIPSITTLSITTGAVGAPVTITGTNFGASQGSGTVSFNGTAASVTSWSDTSIGVTVPSGATSGNVVVFASGVNSNGVNFTVVPAPSITSLSPTSGVAGTVVTITGTNFGSSQGSSTVSFNGTTTTPTSWSAAAIVAPVPSGATTGNVVVTVSGGPSNGVNFVVNGPFSGTITYAYDMLGRLVGVTDVAGHAAGYGYDPVGNITGITRYEAGQVSILGFSPQSGPIGTSVTITGSGFSAASNQDTVTFNGFTATISSASANQIVTTVPTGTTTGPIQVTAPSGSATSATNFTVTSATGPPTITGFTPSIGPPGTLMSISGTNFDTNPANDRLKVNLSLASPPSAVTSTNMTMVVPSLAASGRITLRTPMGLAVGGDFFIPLIPGYTVGYTGRTTVGGSATVSIGTLQSYGMLLFDGIAGQTVSAVMTNDTFSQGACILIWDLSYQLAFQDVLALSCDSPQYPLAVAALPSPGTYTAIVLGANFDVGSVTINLYNVVNINEGITPNGSGVIVNITTPGQQAFLTFTGSPNQAATVATTNSTFGNCNVAVALLDPSGNQVDANTCMGNGTMGPDTLAVSGSYTLKVTPVGSATGSVTVNLTSQ